MKPKCYNCKLFATVDSGYSNYTVEETTIHCMKYHFEPREESYSWHTDKDNEFFKMAENCPDFIQETGMKVEFDVEGEITMEDYKADSDIFNAGSIYFKDGKYR